MIRFLLLSLLIVLFSFNLHAQLLLDDFDSPPGTPLTSLGWTAHRSEGIHPLVISDTALQFPGYPTSPVGGSVEIVGRSSEQGEDVHHTFTSVDSGAVYVSMLVNTLAAPSAGDYFMHLSPSSMGNTYRAKLCVRSSAAGMVQFGIAKSAFPDTAARWTTHAYSIGTTHLLILRYTFSKAGTKDDSVALWIDPPLASPTVVPDVEQTDDGSDPSNIGNVIVRQGSTNYSVLIDGLRIGTRWGDAPLPVRLSSFTAEFAGSGTVAIRWTTESEIRNYGFVLYRSTDGTAGWSVASPFIAGHGTTTTTQEYTFMDTLATSAHASYKLKQIDLDGGESWSETIEFSPATGVKTESTVSAQFLQSYPNPCNPTARIGFVGLKHEQVTLTMYTLLGQRLCTLFSGWVEPGRMYAVTFDGTRYASGIYLYVLEGRGWKAVRRLVLAR